MIVVCPCGQKNRVIVGRAWDNVRCGKCRTTLGEEARRQADRNADIVLDLAAMLLDKEELTKSERRIAEVLAHHQLKEQK